ncbi:MAG: site-2 protease family protein, partial [Nocardioidaceae bacterium]
PALKAGFKPGDEILSVNGTAIDSWSQFSQATRDSADKVMHVVVKRDGATTTLVAHPAVNQLVDNDNPDHFVKAGFLGVTPEQPRERQGVGYVFTTMGDYAKRTGQAIVHLPEKMEGVAKAAVGMQPRDPASPMSVVGASRVAGQVASDDRIDITDRWATLLSLLGVVNLFVALFNFIPLLPLDGGHIAGALYEAARRAVARLRRRPDPGYADVAQMLPIAYAVASVVIVMGVILVWADIVSPVKLTG